MKRVLWLLIAMVSLLLAGCGGSGGPSTGPSPEQGGAARFTVHWPPETRLVPTAAKSVRIVLVKGGSEVATKVAARGSGATTTVTFPNLPLGNLTAEASAHPNADGSGVAQAAGSAPMVTRLGQATNIELTMASTVTRFTITPNPIRMEIGAENAITPIATAFDAQNRIVLTDPAKHHQWTIASPAIATVNAKTGKLTGVSRGETTLTFRDNEHNRTATAVVEVFQDLPVDRVTINPQDPVIEPGNQLQMAASAYDAEGLELGLPLSRYTWTSSNPSAATVSNDGLVSSLSVESEARTTIKVRETKSGKEASTVVTVRPSASGGRIFFVTGSEIRSVDSTGGDMRIHPLPVTRDVPIYVGVGVSPDGTKLYYGLHREAQTDDGTGYVEVWRANINGSGATRLWRREWIGIEKNVMVGSVLPSPDGTKLAFDLGSLSFVRDQFRLLVLDLNTGSLMEKRFDDIGFQLANFTWTGNSGGVALQGMTPEDKLFTAEVHPSSGAVTKWFDKQIFPVAPNVGSNGVIGLGSHDFHPNTIVRASRTGVQALRMMSNFGSGASMAVSANGASFVYVDSNNKGRIAQFTGGDPTAFPALDGAVRVLTYRY